MGRQSLSADESSPLLYRQASGAEESFKDVEVEMVRDEIEDRNAELLKVEFVKILRMSCPVIFAYMLQNSLQTGSILVVGRMVYTLR
jgi:hypothetical protein